MKLRCIAFTQRGLDTAQRILDGFSLEGEADVACGFGPDKTPLAQWTAEAWAHADALVFVGATGIAVRAIAAHVQAKEHDPAVVVIDEAGRWVIPLLSGHIGKANRLALALADHAEATPVITTASDVRGVWAVDTWAVEHGMTVANPRLIKKVTGALLAGGEVTLAAEVVDLRGPLPAGVRFARKDEAPDVVVSPYAGAGEACGALHLVPRCVTAGMGCRKGAGVSRLRSALDAALEEARLAHGCLAEISSIDLKAQEPGLVELAEQLGAAFKTHTANELASVDGTFAHSDFVQETVGVDNVCERAALASGGALVLPKRADDGVTVALARMPKVIDFQEEE